MKRKADLLTETVLSVTGLYSDNSELFFHLINKGVRTVPHDSFEQVCDRDLRRVYLLRNMRKDQFPGIIGYAFYETRRQHEEGGNYAYARLNQQNLRADERIRRRSAQIRTGRH